MDEKAGKRGKARLVGEERGNCGTIGQIKRQDCAVKLTRFKIIFTCMVHDIVATVAFVIQLPSFLLALHVSRDSLIPTKSAYYMYMYSFKSINMSANAHEETHHRSRANDGSESRMSSVGVGSPEDRCARLANSKIHRWAGIFRRLFASFSEHCHLNLFRSRLIALWRVTFLKSCV